MSAASPGTSLQYADFLPSLIDRKIQLGHYANRPVLPLPVYEADQGWDLLFTDYLAARDAKRALKRAGASAKDIVDNSAREQEYTPETTDRMTKEAIDDTLRK